MRIYKKYHMNLYQKFISVMILGGILPMLLLSTVILNQMFKGYKVALLDSYEKSLDYVVGSVENMLNNYDEILKIIYYYMEGDGVIYNYNYENAYTIKSILEISGDEQQTEEAAILLRNYGMITFVRYIALTDRYIDSAFFIDYRNRVYGYASNSYFEDANRLREVINIEAIDKTSKDMQIFSTHSNDYFKNRDTKVYSLARNYFDLLGSVGNYKYLGSLFIEIDVKSLDHLFSNMEVYEQGEIYIINQENYCIYSNVNEHIGKIIPESNIKVNEEAYEELFIQRILENGWRIIYKIPTSAVFTQIKRTQSAMLLILGISVVVLIFSSVIFSRKMTQPIRAMMTQMQQIEGGNFDSHLPVVSNDELGILSKRFNQMAIELNSYINKYYIAQIKQSEAELTALKSQIYPHFLYNTLEVIRMTAVSNDDQVVSEMIESLAEQIHYIVGSTNDRVTLEKEIDIIKKYIFLLNCRINGEINLSVKLNGLSEFIIPQLILQPLIENAYVHGLKPKCGIGNIDITAIHHNKRVEINVMDNGVGMDDKALENLNNLFRSDETGIRSGDTWHSIGMKNVYDRIKHLYGTNYGLEITSSVGVGTLVKIVLPYKEERALVED